MKVLGLMFLLAGMAGVLAAVPSVPEVDPGSAGTGLALLTGALLIARGRRKK